MLPKIDTLIESLWKKTEKIILEDNEINPMIFGIKENNEGNFTPIDLFLNQSLYEWGNVDDRFELYYKAFCAQKQMKLEGLMSIFESWVTTLDIKQMVNMGLSPESIQTQEDFINLRERHPKLFTKSESLSIYLDYIDETRLVWGRIFREGNNPNGKIVYLSEYVEHSEESMDGIIREAKIKANLENY